MPLKVIVLGSVPVLYESGAGGGILIGLLFWFCALEKGHFYGCVPVLWDFTGLDLA